MGNGTYIHDGCKIAGGKRLDHIAMSVIVNSDVMLAGGKMSLAGLSEKAGITMSNLSIMKKGKASAIRFSP